MDSQRRYPYYIRVISVALFNLVVASAERHAAGGDRIQTARRNGYYEMRTHDHDLWQDVYLYGQMIAQAQDDFIEAGEDPIEAD